VGVNPEGVEREDKSFDELVAEALDGRAGPAELAMLERVMRGDPLRRRAYLRRAHLVALLIERHGGLRPMPGRSIRAGTLAFVLTAAAALALWIGLAWWP